MTWIATKIPSVKESGILLLSTNHEEAEQRMKGELLTADKHDSDPALETPDYKCVNVPIDHSSPVSKNPFPAVNVFASEATFDKL